MHSARPRREAPTHCGHCGGSLTRRAAPQTHARFSPHWLLFATASLLCGLRVHPSGPPGARLFPSIPLFPRGADGIMAPFCLKGPPSGRLSWNHPDFRPWLPRRTALPFDPAFPACDGRNNGFILRPRPFERGFVQEKTHYPSTEATKRSFALRFRSSQVRRTERWLDSAPEAASEGGGDGSLLLRGLSTPGQGQGEEPAGDKFSRSEDAGNGRRGRSERRERSPLSERLPPLPQLG